jgi:hypothetical protein
MTIGDEPYKKKYSNTNFYADYYFHSSIWFGIFFYLQLFTTHKLSRVKTLDGHDDCPTECEASCASIDQLAP